MPTVELTSATGQRMLDNLPPYYSKDETVLSYLQVVGSELDRAEVAVENVRDGFFPHKASDTFRLLGMWEASLRLPVEQGSVETRRALLLSKIRGRRSGSAVQWRDFVTTSLGSSSWKQAEHYPGSYQLSVSVPYDPASVAGTTFAETLRQGTPAHLQLILGFDGFIVDASTVDTESV